METLTFLAILGFCAAILIWYIANVNGGEQGEMGLLGVVREKVDVALGKSASYVKKERTRTKEEVRREAFANRGKNSKTRTANDDDVHAMRRVKLRTHDGEVIKTSSNRSPDDLKKSNEKPEKYRSKSAKRFKSKTRTSRKSS